MPLHPDITVKQIPGPRGDTVPAITDALAPPAHAPNAIHHDNGSVTFEGHGEQMTLPAQAVRVLESVRAQEVTEAEIMAAAAEAARYGMDPLLVAQLRKASAGLKAFRGH
ncbi:hypothetical protein [Streptomyces sp. NPDC101150]|uniref:hypothetical protein n=1 Tax=Streptomyces sp. NPDC101150 TaxID=3366114 RepID=UPI0038061B74